MRDELVIRASGVGKVYNVSNTLGYATLRESLNAVPRHVWAVARGSRTTIPHVTSRREFWSLCDVSFEVRRGEVFGVIGRNGSGKSTLLKILSRITIPTAGRVEIRGRVASLLEVGTGFHPELTGRENIFLNGSILGMSRTMITSIFDEIVEFSEINQFIDMPVKRYSSGMYVRLAFAVAAHLDPDVLILDEVLAVGDAQFQKKCSAKINEIAHSRNRTIILVSHGLSSITSMCDRAMLLDHGTMIDIGPPEEVVRKYLSIDDAATLAAS